MKFVWIFVVIAIVTMVVGCICAKRRDEKRNKNSDE